MKSKAPATPEREPSPVVDSDNAAARDEGGSGEMTPEPDLASQESRIERAETRTELAEARTEQAEARTERSKTRTEQAEARSEQAIRDSEISYRRLFEAAKEGILILEADTGRISDVNPSLTEILGFSHGELVGTPVWELGAFTDILSNKAKFEELAGHGYVRSENLPLKTKDGRQISVEFVSTVYRAGDRNVIQCNIRDVTGQKQAELRLLQLAAIVESSNDGIIGKDLDGVITSWNKGAEKIFGYSASEMVGTSITRLIPADRQHEEKQILRTIKRGESVEHFETLRLTKDGTLIDVLVTASPIKDAKGEVIGVSKVAHDITGRKLGVKAQQESEARYRTLFDHAPDGIVIADSQSYYLDANASICQMLGYTREELIGLHASDIVVPEEIPQIELALEAIKTHAKYHREWLFRRKDGSMFPAEVIATQMPDGNLMGMIRDITERKRTEEALRVSEEHFRFLNDLAEATRTLADPAQIMAEMARMLGESLHASRCAYADVESDGEQFTILHDYTDGCASTVGDYQLSLFGPLAVRTLRRGHTLIIRDVEAELPAGEGADMFNAIGIKAIITCPLVKNGVLRAMMAVHQTTPRDWKPNEISKVQDVVERCWSTIERRSAEEQIHQLNAELEQRVIERTSQLETANNELEAFSYSVSHDLRTPLRAVDGFSQAVLEDYSALLPEDGQRYLQTIRQGAQRMGMLIDDLLTFSRLSRTPLNKQEVNTGQLVRSVLDDLVSHEPGRQIDLHVNELPTCMGDPALLRQVWINLLSNALKYTRKRDRARVEIGCDQTPEGHVFYVRDNGTGFDMLYADKLFGVFQRLHRAEDYEGTGVGLAIVQRVIHRHGGRIWAQAALDQGATFYFTLEPNIEA
jgi:PAS domain S-box-containing protein